ncbi:MAG: AAA family ATPase [Clostridia bacterium]|nr:AAA family ATPase [Clostridia bacterium]
MDNNENKKPNKKLRLRNFIVLLLVLVLVGALLIGAVKAMSNESGQIPLTGLIRSETLYLFAIGLLLIPVLLLALTVTAFMTDRKAEKSEPKEITFVSPDGTPISSLTPEKEEEEEGERFCMLSEIDRKKNTYGHTSYDRSVTLETLCENFRNYAANKLRLYYDIEDIRKFISGMAVSKLLILQGMSGTGKTSLAHAFGAFTDNSSTVIPVQPMWKERTDLVGYYNEFTKRFNETLLLEKMYEANYSKDMYVTVLDEMNIARVEYYFAEFLSLLELPNAEERYLDVVSDKWETDPKQFRDGRIKLPENMWFIGTANNDDSTFAISDKVYDRAMIMNLDSKCERFVAPVTEKMFISADQFADLVKKAVKEHDISLRNQKRLDELDKYLIKHFHITFGNRIMKQIKTYIPVYISCGGEELTALDDILAKKIIRKLETQNPIYLRNAAEGLISYLDELFGADKMPLCKEYIHRLERNA